MGLHRLEIRNGLFLDGMRLRCVNEYSITQNDCESANLLLDMDVNTMRVSRGCKKEIYVDSVRSIEKQYIGGKHKEILFQFKLSESQFEEIVKTRVWKELNNMLNAFQTMQSSEEV